MDTYLATDSRHRRSPQIAMKVDQVCSFQPATHFIHFHHDLQTQVMSTVSSQVGVHSLSFFLTYFLSFYLSRFSFYININDIYGTNNNVH